jgi:ribose 5-phosphate isomerase B
MRVLLKEHFKQTLASLGHLVDDHGTHSEASVDYPPICIAVAAAAEGRADRGICSAGGSGEQTANKFRESRRACNDLHRTAVREHNTNVLSMGGRIVAFGLADEILTLWLRVCRRRHQRRVDQIGS